MKAATVGVPLIVAAVLTGCAGKATDRSADTKHEARAQRAEQHDFDAALRRIPRAEGLVDSYHIDFEVLTASVNRSQWDRLGTAGQDAVKASLWRAWRDVYIRRHPGTTERIFLKVEDLQANDLGSYFE